MLNPETNEKLLAYALWKYGTMTVIVDAASPSFQVLLIFKSTSKFGKYDFSFTQAESIRNQHANQITEIT